MGKYLFFCLDLEMVRGDLDVAVWGVGLGGGDIRMRERVGGRDEDRGEGEDVGAACSYVARVFLRLAIN